MEVVALVGSSGSGKSYKAIAVTKELDIEYIIDDGLFIKGTNVIAGKSAKREQTVIGAVKRALFSDHKHREEVKRAIEGVKPNKILVLGTSDKMVDKIVKVLNLSSISKRIYIEDISTQDEIMAAKRQRRKEGKHVIPVPTFQIKKDFSGYFIDSLKILRRREDKIDNDQSYEKTVVRPTFSYLGKYSIADSVIKDLTKYAGSKIEGISKVYNIYIRTIEQGIIISVDINIIYGKPLIPMINDMQAQIIREVEHMTSLNILSVDVNVKKMTKM